MKKEKWLAYTLFIAHSMTLLLNYLTATGYLTGHSQKDISNHYHTLITPSSADFFYLVRHLFFTSYHYCQSLSDKRSYLS
ncbi:hypothetical protein ABG811_03070 [Streptococcus iniae]